ncbi:MAG: DUF349 domain-containing protein [Balneolaceae bacterium]
MSESVKNTSSDNNLLLENKFIYVTTSGEVFLKETSVFEERKIGSVDPEEAEKQLEKFTSIFDDLSEKTEQFIKSWEDKADIDVKKLKEAFSDFKNELISEDAIGDFEKLSDRLEAAFTEIENKAVKDKARDKKADDSAVTDSKEEEQDKPDEAEPVSKAEKEQDEKELKTEDSAAPEDAEVDKEEKSDSVKEYYESLAEKAEKIKEMTDWPYVSMEFENIHLDIEKRPEPSDLDISGYVERIKNAQNEFEERKKSHYEEQKRVKEENLEKKKDLLKQFEEIIDKENWTAENEVRKITYRWDQIKPIPKNEAENLDKKFEKFLSIFKEHKIDRLVQKKQREQDNLMGKLVIVEKMEKFLDTLPEDVNWKEAEKDFENLSRQWRKIGRVPIEKNQEMWDKFHDVQDKFHSKRFENDKKYRKQIEKFIENKKKLIEEAEALVDLDDLAEAARRVNKLHHKWKKTGNLPQKEENEMWDRFKTATDAFNEKKADNVDLLREQENQNLEEKYKLIEKAEELKDSDDFEGTHQKLQNLMKQWKEVGPVPKRKSGKIWKKFKGAMDHFYDRRRDHFKEVKEKRKSNLEEKKDILDKLKALKDHEDPVAAVEEAKPLQEEFKKAGYVPIKFKNKLWKEYRETCDVIYDRFRAAKSAAEIVGKENVSDFSTDDLADIQKKQKRAGKLRQEISKINSEIIQMKESLSYFKPQKGSTLLDDAKEKIEKAEKSLVKKENELDNLHMEIDKLKKNI